MSKEDKFVTEIINQTKGGKIIWSSISPGEVSDFIFQSPYAYQAFDATYKNTDKKSYRLVLVQKKMPSHNADFDMPEEKHHTELLVILSGKLITTLNEYGVEVDLLNELSSIVEDKNEESSELFKDFGD